MDAPGQLPTRGEKAVLWPGRVREADGVQQTWPGLEHEAAAGSPVLQAHGTLGRPGRPPAPGPPRRPRPAGFPPQRHGQRPEPSASPGGQLLDPVARQAAHQPQAQPPRGPSRGPTADSGAGKKAPRSRPGRRSEGAEGAKPHTLRRPCRDQDTDCPSENGQRA